TLRVDKVFPLTPLPFRRLVVRPSRLHSAVAAATALQTATRRRGTKIRRPVPRCGGDARTGRETVSFRFDFFAFAPFSFRTATFYTLSVSNRDGGRVLHERNAGGVFVYEAGPSHQPMAHHLVRPLPRLR